MNPIDDYKEAIFQVFIPTGPNSTDLALPDLPINVVQSLLDSEILKQYPFALSSLISSMMQTLVTVDTISIGVPKQISDPLTASQVTVKAAAIHVYISLIMLHLQMLVPLIERVQDVLQKMRDGATGDCLQSCDDIRRICRQVDEYVNALDQETPQIASVIQIAPMAHEMTALTANVLEMLECIKGIQEGIALKQSTAKFEIQFAEIFQEMKLVCPKFIEVVDKLRVQIRTAFGTAFSEPAFSILMQYLSRFITPIINLTDVGLVVAYSMPALSESMISAVSVLSKSFFIILSNLVAVMRFRATFDVAMNTALDSQKQLIPAIDKMMAVLQHIKENDGSFTLIQFAATVFKDSSAALAKILGEFDSRISNFLTSIKGDKRFILFAPLRETSVHNQVTQMAIPPINATMQIMDGLLADEKKTLPDLIPVLKLLTPAYSSFTMQINQRINEEYNSTEKKKMISIRDTVQSRMTNFIAAFGQYGRAQNEWNTMAAGFAAMTLLVSFFMLEPDSKILRALELTYKHSTTAVLHFTKYLALLEDTLKYLADSVTRVPGVDPETTRGLIACVVKQIDEAQAEAKPTIRTSMKHMDTVVVHLEALVDYLGVASADAQTNDAFARIKTCTKCLGDLRFTYRQMRMLYLYHHSMYMNKFAIQFLVMCQHLMPFMPAAYSMQFKIMMQESIATVDPLSTAMHRVKDEIHITNHAYSVISAVAPAAVAKLRNVLDKGKDLLNIKYYTTMLTESFAALTTQLDAVDHAMSHPECMIATKTIKLVQLLGPIFTTDVDSLTKQLTELLTTISTQNYPATSLSAVHVTYHILVILDHMEFLEQTAGMRDSISKARQIIILAAPAVAAGDASQTQAIIKAAQAIAQHLTALKPIGEKMTELLNRTDLINGGDRAPTIHQSISTPNMPNVLVPPMPITAPSTPAGSASIINPADTPVAAMLYRPSTPSNDSETFHMPIPASFDGIALPAYSNHQTSNDNSLHYTPADKSVSAFLPQPLKPVIPTTAFPFPKPQAAATPTAAAPSVFPFTSSTPTPPSSNDRPLFPFPDSPSSPAPAEKPLFPFPTESKPSKGFSFLGDSGSDDDDEEEEMIPVFNGLPSLGPPSPANAFPEFGGSSIFGNSSANVPKCLSDIKTDTAILTQLLNEYQSTQDPSMLRQIDEIVKRIKKNQASLDAHFE